MPQNTAEKLEQKTKGKESLRLIGTAKSFLNRDMNDVGLPKGTQSFVVPKIDPVRRGALYYFEFYNGEPPDCQDYGNGTKIKPNIFYRVSKGTEKLYLNL